MVTNAKAFELFQQPNDAYREIDVQAFMTHSQMDSTVEGTAVVGDAVIGVAVGLGVGAIVGVNVHVPQLKGQLLMMSACCAALYSVYRASIVAHGPSRVISHSSQGYPR